MSKRPYVVNEADLDFVVDWIYKQLRESKIEHRNEGGEYDFDKLLAMKDGWEAANKNDAQAIHQWCEQYLSENEWTRLKTTIRQKRLKTSSRHTSHALKNVNLKLGTWQKLTRLKKKLDTDHSGAIDFLITEYNRNNKATK